MKEIFASAVELEPGARSAFLRDACGPDQALLADVAALLESHESNASVSTIDTPPSTQKVADGWNGRRIGPFRILHRIGSGGMGDVYLALRADDAFNQRVAIKLVKTDVNTQEILHRFRHERQILAALDHPHIARLMDGGTTEEGLPYFVMDYVEGTPITAYCDRHSLAIPERLGLFRDVCLAVHYVHQNLIVHRDLKPSNILVTTDGVTKLLDFGIAKLLRPEFFSQPVEATQVDSRMLTPWYASPEQVRGEAITTASDVYSLGVLLYELLAARRPYILRTDAQNEILNAVCDQEPQKPSASLSRMEKPSLAEVVAARAVSAEKLKRELSDDLDTIVLKALRKEPQRRYSSAEQLAEDIRRYLQGLPVTAQRNSGSYRAGKFIRRHKTGVAAAILLVLSLIAGVLATSWQARVARSERARAEQQFNDVRRLATSLLFDFDAAVRNLPGSTPARQLLVQRALEYLHRLANQAQGDAGLQRELAEAYLKVGDVQGNPYEANLGDTQGAVKSYEQALSISQSLNQLNANNPDTQKYLARSYQSLGQVLPSLGKPTEAAADLHRSIDLLQSLHADAETRYRLANCYQVLGDLQGHVGIPNLGDAVASQASYRKSLELYQAILAQEPDDNRARAGMATVEIRIGDRLLHGDPHAAMKDYQLASTTFATLLAADPNNQADRRRLGLTYEKIGGVEESLGNNKEALQNYSNASALDRELLRADPNNAQAKMNLAVSLRDAGDLLYGMHDRPVAIARYREIADILHRLSASEPDNVLVRGRYSEILVVLGGTLAETGEAPEAHEATAQGLSIAKELAAREDATADELYAYAESFLTCEPKDLRQPQTALDYAKRALAKSVGEQADYLDLLARAYFQSGDVSQAILTEEKALTSTHDAQDQQKLKRHLAQFTTSGK
jgi:non-specific serine/threonine protein kinase/serine/threonine-protein kinase